jgi:hypothetical protein
VLVNDKAMSNSDFAIFCNAIRNTTTIHSVVSVGSSSVRKDALKVMFKKCAENAPVTMLTKASQGIGNVALNIRSNFFILVALVLPGTAAAVRESSMFSVVDRTSTSPAADAATALVRVPAGPTGDATNALCTFAYGGVSYDVATEFYDDFIDRLQHDVLIPDPSIRSMISSHTTSASLCGIAAFDSMNINSGNASQLVIGLYTGSIADAWDLTGRIWMNACLANLQLQQCVSAVVALLVVDDLQRHQQQEGEIQQYNFGQFHFITVSCFANYHSLIPPPPIVQPRGS